MDTYNLSFPDVAIDAILATAYELQNAGYIFRGVASELYGTPTERSWVLAGEGETGHGFTSPVPKGYIGVCVFNGTSWTGKLLKCVSIDSAPTNGSTNAVSSGGAYASISQLADTVNEALDNLTFTDTTPSAFLGDYINMKVSTTNGGIERIMTFFTILSATASKAGLLSAADKAKLDAILNILRSLEIEDTTSYADLGDKIVESLKATIGGTEETISTFQILAATASKAGLLSAADKAKLDAILNILRSLEIEDTTSYADLGTKIVESIKATIGGTEETISTFQILAATASKAGLMSAADKAILDRLNIVGCKYAGIATPSTIPLVVDVKIFYIAVQGGNYSNFGLTVPEGISILKNDGHGWTIENLVRIDDHPTDGSAGIARSGGTFAMISSEAAARESADATLSASVVAEQNARIAAIQKEETARKAAIQEEKNAREHADGMMIHEIETFEQGVRDTVAEYKPIVIQGDVQNAPDEVDLTSTADNLLKFKDNIYNPVLWSGMGRIYLRKNIIPDAENYLFDGFVSDVPVEGNLEGEPDAVFWDRINTIFVCEKDGAYYETWTACENYVPARQDVIYMYDGTPYVWDGDEFSVDENVVPNLKNILTQNMLSHENTIYVIRWDYNLNNSTIEIPENCILEFDGGSLENGDVVLNNTLIVSDIPCFDCDVEGTAANDTIEQKWFSYSNDFTDAFKKIVALSTSSSKPVHFNKGEYSVNDGIHQTVIKNPIDFNESVIKMNVSNEDCYLRICNCTAGDVESADFDEFENLVNARSQKVTTSKYFNSYVQIGSNEVEIQRAYEGVAPSRKFEHFFIDENGCTYNEPFNDSITVSSGRYIKKENDVRIENVTFELHDNYEGTIASGQYRKVGIFVQDSIDVEFVNVNYKTVQTNSTSGYNYFRVEGCANISFRNVYSDLTPVTGDSTYVFYLYKIIGLSFDSVCTPIPDDATWGVTGSDYITDWSLRDCNLNRIDCHYRLNNLYVNNCTVGNKGIPVTGYGQLIVRDTKFYSHYAVYIRVDYGSWFDGDIILENVTVEYNAKTCWLVGVEIKNFDYRCDCSRINKIADSVSITNATIINNYSYEGGEGSSWEDEQMAEETNVFGLYTSGYTTSTEFDLAKQTKILPNLICNNITVLVPHTKKGKAFLYRHTYYDLWSVSKDQTMKIVVNGFHNPANSDVGWYGSLVYNGLANQVAAQLADDGYAYAIEIKGSSIDWVNTKVRGFYSHEGEGGAIVGYFNQKTDFIISSSFISGLGDASPSVSFSLTNCMLKVFDATKPVNVNSRIVFDKCVFDVSRTGQFYQYRRDFQTRRLFQEKENTPANTNISIFNTVFTPQLAQALHDYSIYDDNRFPSVVRPTYPFNESNMFYSKGMMVYDTTLNKPIFAKEIDQTTGAITWVDATGTTV